MRIAVTGGAGFIGSHLVEKLINKHEVVIFDNLSSGKRDNIPENIELEEVDIKNEGVCKEVLKGFDVIFHLAANPAVNTFPEDKDKDFDNNLVGIKSVLDACIANNINDFVFASSSVVYGEKTYIPTPESHEFNPISMYGATKAGGEHICRVYENTFDIDLTIARLANIVGSRNDKGVIYDFVQKLKKNPDHLEILGNGNQRKSYLHIEDTVEGIITAWKSDETVFNIGAEDSIDVDRIADIVSSELGVDPDYSYTGGEKGWTGDVPEMRLDISKLQEEGWNPKRGSVESVRKTAQELILD